MMCYLLSIIQLSSIICVPLCFNREGKWACGIHRYDLHFQLCVERFMVVGFLIPSIHLVVVKIFLGVTHVEPRQ